MKSATPADWKEETPSSTMRLAQFKLPEGRGRPGGRRTALIFVSPGGGGVEANLERQSKKFEPPAGKDKVDEKQEKIKIGQGRRRCYQDIDGHVPEEAVRRSTRTRRSRRSPDYRQLYVIFEAKDGGTVLVGSGCSARRRPSRSTRRRSTSG